jgi:hypothetical protein
MFNETVSAKTTYDNFDMPGIELETKIQVKTLMIDESYRNKDNISELLI